MSERYVRVQSLFNGISKQPAHVRFINQVEDADNVRFSVLDGASNRPGTYYVAQVTGLVDAGNYRLHGIDRDGSERYLVIYGDSTLRVFDLDGAEITTTLTTEAQTYLDSGDATADQLRLVTLKDYTLVLNTTVAVATSTSEDYPVTATYRNADVLMSRNPAANAYFKTDDDTASFTAGYWQYTLVENGFASWTRDTSVSADYTRADGVWDSTTYNPMGFKVTFRDANSVENTYEVVHDFVEEPATTMDDIALTFQRKLQAAGATTALIYWEPSGANSGSFVVVAPHRGAGSAVVNMTSPSAGFDLTASTSNRPFDFSDGTATAGSGSATSEVPILDRWERKPAPDQPNAVIDESTMPIQLVRTSASLFNGSTITWKFRETGDDDSNEAPSIWTDGSTLSDISYHRNRLILAGDENIVMSQSGDLFNFYVAAYDNIVDSDPIDIQISSEDVTIIDFVVPFRKSIMVFTKAGRQFEMNAPEALTPSTAAITESTSYKTVAIRPQPLSSMIYFAGKLEDAAAIYEYYYDDSRVTNLAADITAHVFDLLPATLRTIQTSTNNNVLLVLPTDSNKIYVYSQFWSGTKKDQSAWTVYTFDSGYRIADIAVIGNNCYLLVNSNNEFFIERLPLAREVA